MLWERRPDNLDGILGSMVQYRMSLLKGCALPSQYPDCPRTTRTEQRSPQPATQRPEFQIINTRAEAPITKRQPAASFSISSIYNNINSVSKPSKWIRINLPCEDSRVVVFSETKCRREGDIYTTVVAKEVTIGDTLKLHCTVMAQPINLSNFQIQIDIVNSIGELEKVLRKMDSLKVCSGCSHPALGEEIKPVSVYRDKYGQWRHCECPMLISSGTSCKFCEGMNKILARSTFCFQRNGSKQNHLRFILPKKLKGPETSRKEQQAVRKIKGQVEDFNGSCEETLSQRKELNNHNVEAREIPDAGQTENGSVKIEYLSADEVKIKNEPIDSVDSECFSDVTWKHNTSHPTESSRDYLVPMKLENAVHIGGRKTFYVIPKLCLTRLEDSNDPEVRRYLKKGDESSAVRAKKLGASESAQPEIKCETVDLETLSYETVRPEKIYALNFLAIPEVDRKETVTTDSHPVEQTLTELDQSLWNFCGIFGNINNQQSTLNMDPQSSSETRKELEVAVSNGEKKLTAMGEKNANLHEILAHSSISAGISELISTRDSQFDFPAQYNQYEEWLNNSSNSSDYLEKQSDNSKAQIPRKIYVCKLCQKTFDRLSSYKRHMVSLFHTGKRLHSCKICRKSFSQRSHLNRHMSFHIESSHCDYCRNPSLEASNLDSTHSQIHGRKARFHCEVCHKSYICRSHLKAHLFIHTGERPYACEICEKTFRQNSHRTSHMLTHSGVRSFQCDECQKSFTSKGYLQQHILIHTGQGDHECSFCRKQFGTENCLRKHVSVHTGSRPFRCEVCCKMFRLKGTLKSHMAIHSKERPYQCDICCRRFCRKSTYSSHMSAHGRTSLQFPKHDLTRGVDELMANILGLESASNENALIN